MNDKVERHSYLLVDGALLASVTGEEPVLNDWVHPTWQGEGSALGPLLIDIEEVVEKGCEQMMMELVNTVRPQVHLSYIESALGRESALRHLSQLAVVVSEQKTLYNLRLSDCVAFDSFSEILTATQWAVIMQGITRWCGHLRCGKTKWRLVAEPSISPATLPLTLSSEQLSQLDELVAPQSMLAHVTEILGEERIILDMCDQYELAVKAREIWRASKCCDLIVLRWLTIAALKTEGEVFQDDKLKDVLMEGSRIAIRKALKLTNLSVNDSHLNQLDGVTHG